MPNQDWKKQQFHMDMDNPNPQLAGDWFTESEKEFIDKILKEAEAEGAKRILNKWQEELRKLEK